jgi:hypothetical protein
MSHDADPRYHVLLERHLALNRATWRTLEEHGIAPTGAVRLEFAYRAPNATAAGQLVDLLLDRTDYDASVQRSGDASAAYSVVGTTQLTRFSPEVLDRWVEWMVSAGLDYGCEFDGWGTEE